MILSAVWPNRFKSLSYYLNGLSYFVLVNLIEVETKEEYEIGGPDTSLATEKLSNSFES